MRKAIYPVLLGLALSTTAGLAAAAPKPEDDIRYRQAVFNVIGHNFGGVLNAIAKGDRPYDLATAQKTAKLLEALAPLPFDSFGPGTDQGAPNKASPRIWQEPDKFKESAQKFQLEVSKLYAAAGDPAALKAQVGQVGKACKGCHDDFRVK